MAVLQVARELAFVCGGALDGHRQGVPAVVFIQWVELCRVGRMGGQIEADAARREAHKSVWPVQFHVVSARDRDWCHRCTCRTTRVHVKSLVLIRECMECVQRQVYRLRAPIEHLHRKLTSSQLHVCQRLIRKRTRFRRALVLVRFDVLPERRRCRRRQLRLGLIGSLAERRRVRKLGNHETRLGEIEAARQVTAHRSAARQRYSARAHRSIPRETGARRCDRILRNLPSHHGSTVRRPSSAHAVRDRSGQVVQRRVVGRGSPVECVARIRQA